ncbi:hypothetical protein [Mesorhizobium sp. GbtcB19]|uniref:hypothetical protein n=1 Tax=Mesorhizobium sp. GbtcB19 TaxID=2824764 RepID=UPI001C3062B7|nr:hypothetical protein [Mesorhizobium sp. GbtcB19]
MNVLLSRQASESVLPHLAGIGKTPFDGYAGIITSDGYILNEGDGEYTWWPGQEAKHYGSPFIKAMLRLSYNLTITCANDYIDHLKLGRESFKKQLKPSKRFGGVWDLENLSQSTVPLSCWSNFF